MSSSRGVRSRYIRLKVAKLKGRSSALGALGRCGPSGLKVQRGAFIYADIEPDFQCNSGWFQGWFEEMQKAGRGRGGLYVSPQQFPFSRPYRAALRATLDIFGKALNPDPPIFFPDPPASARLLWAQQPVPFFKKDIDPQSFLPESFSPSQPADERGVYGPGMSVLWQYGGNCRISKKNPKFVMDMNLANEQCFRSLWNLTAN